MTTRWRVWHEGLIWLALATGTALAVWGLSHMKWPAALPIGGNALRRYLAFLLVCTLLVTTGAKRSRQSPIVVGSLLCSGLAILAGALWSLLVTLWFAVASAVFGRGILAGFGTDRCSRDWIANFLIGACVYGTAVGLLAHFPINYPGLYGAALAAPLVLGSRVCVELIGSIRSWVTQNQSVDGRVRWLEVPIAVVALVHFAVALMPEVGHDALAMHLFVPAHLALRHKWGFDVSTYVWAVMPMLADWIFSIGYLLGGETAARLINVGFIFALGWLIRDLVLWAGGSALGARWAVLIFLSTPLTFTESSSLFIESVWAALVVAGALAVLRACSTTGNHKIDLPVAGILLGGAAAVKLVTIPYLLPLLIVLIVCHKRWLSNIIASPHAILFAAFCFFLFSISPYVTAWVITKNPVFPFFNHLFASKFFPVIYFANPLFKTPIDLRLLYELTFDSGKFLEARPGAAGFQWLLLFPGSLVALIVGKKIRCLSIVAIGCAAVFVVFQYQSYLRYVFPASVFLTASTGFVLSEVAVFQVWLFKFFRGLFYFCAALNLLFFHSGTSYGRLAAQPLLSQDDRKAYLHKHLPIRNVVELINGLNIGKRPVAVFSSPLTAGLAADAIYPNWYNYSFEGQVEAANSESEIAESLVKKGVDFVVLDRDWGTAEKRRLIEGVTEKISEVGSITVRALRKEYRFQTELLKNHEFISAAGWTLTVGATMEPGDGARVSVGSPAYQLVPVAPGRRYLNSVKARCESEATQGRVQVNWLDARREFMSTDILVFDCTTSLGEHSMQVVAPDKAAFAAVYASGHSLTYLVFRENSFRQ